ncbi:hypothetical protein A9Q87_06805 [Flavobacteriales bacterium 34_180_T64]|nr:hypothetical protein A9Q87_06805 [Flavobacteriales bacterium 34_180_T64]
MFVFSTVLVVSCDKEDILVEQQEQGANDYVLQNRPIKIDVCHYSADEDQWKLINVSPDAWADHVLHGDVRLDDQDGDGYVPDNECGIGPMGDCDDTDATVNPGAENCLCQTNCSSADLDLYGPYFGLNYFEDFDGFGNPAIALNRDIGVFGVVQVVYSLNFPNEWEFVVFDEAFDCLNPPGLPCDDPNVCPHAMTISEEDALCLIEQALSLDLPLLRTNELTADNVIKKL